MVEATEKTQDALIAAQISDEELLDYIAYFRDEVERMQRSLYDMEQEALARMERNGATSIPSAQYTCEVVRKNTYDQAGFIPLKEMLNSEDLAEVWTREHQELVTIPEKWATVKVIAKAKRYGTDALAVVERARIPERPSLKFQVKER